MQYAVHTRYATNTDCDTSHCTWHSTIVVSATIELSNRIHTSPYLVTISNLGTKKRVLQNHKQVSNATLPCKQDTSYGLIIMFNNENKTFQITIFYKCRNFAVNRKRNQKMNLESGTYLVLLKRFHREGSPWLSVAMLLDNRPGTWVTFSSSSIPTKFLNAIS